MMPWRLWASRRLKALAIALVIGLPIGMSARAGVSYLVAGGIDVGASGPAARYENEDHFPGAVLLYAAEPQPAPLPGGDLVGTPGTTGSVPLPDLPIPAGYDAAGDLAGTVIPAKPFSMAGAGTEDRVRALTCLSTAIYYEAGNQTEDGMRAVAQVILNRVRHPAFPATVCGVIYQGSERAGCQFSYACDGSMARTPVPSVMAACTRVAAAALAGYVYAPVGLATNYHTYQVSPKWNRTMVMTAAIGMHFFHRWKGFWGTPAAFSQRYRGGEPMPGPHRPLPLPSPALPELTLASATLPIMPPAPTPLRSIQPGYAETSTAKPATGPQDNSLPGDSQILDRWKDSGRPLR